MLDERKTKGQIITELCELRQRLIIFEQEQKKLKLNIAERKRAENIMHARLRLLEFAESHSLEEFTQATLDESEALTASTIGFYHLVEADQRTLSLQTWSTNTLQHMCTAEGKGQHYDVAEAGVWVDCVHQRRPVIHNSYDALPHRKGMPPGHAPVVRELVVPIFRANKIVAIIGLGNKPSDYDEWDVEAVSLLGDLSWDITERKGAEEALRDREAKYRAAVETSADGFCIADMEGRFLEFNDAFVGLLDYSRKELLSMSVPDIEAQKTPAEIATIIEKVRHEGHDIFETRLRSKDGRVWPAEPNITYWPIDGGRMFFFVRDITERKRAEEELKRQREEMQVILDSVPAMIFYKDQENRFIRVNRELANLTGLPREEIEGKTAFEIYTSQAEDYWKDDLEVIRTGNLKKNIIEPLEAAGEIRWVQTDKIPYKDAQGNIIGVIGFSVDITERKRADEALRRLNEELEQRVLERTEELRYMVKQLQGEVTKRQQTQEFLMKSENRLRQLTSQVLTAQEEERRRLALELHDDLGQLLTVLKFRLRAIQRKAPPECSETRESLEHALDFINEVVDGIRRLSQNLRPSILDELGLVAALKNLFEEFSNQGIPVTIDLGDIQGLFSQDAELNIYRIFQESFNNIAKYAQASKVSVNIKSQDGSVAFQVEDNGRGFDYQSVINENITGRGLGLTAMDERARMLGGSLNIWSQKGQGTKITLIVPIQG